MAHVLENTLRRYKGTVQNSDGGSKYNCNLNKTLTFRRIMAEGMKWEHSRVIERYNSNRCLRLGQRDLSRIWPLTCTTHALCPWLWGSLPTAGTVCKVGWSIKGSFAIVVELRFFLWSARAIRSFFPVLHIDLENCMLVKNQARWLCLPMLFVQGNWWVYGSYKVKL